MMKWEGSSSERILHGIFSGLTVSPSRVEVGWELRHPGVRSLVGEMCSSDAGVGFIIVVAVGIVHESRRLRIWRSLFIEDGK